MNYWVIKIDIASKDVGNVFPQVHCLTQAHAHQLDSHSMPDFEPTLSFVLEPRAKFSDIIGQATINASGILISERFKKELIRFNLTNHRFIKAKIQDQSGNTEKPYFWLHLYEPDSLNWIHYKRSKFYYTEYGFREGNVEIESFADSRKKKDELVGNMGTIEAEKILLNENFDKNLDLFYFEYFASDVHISDRLKNFLEENAITGLRFEKGICG